MYSIKSVVFAAVLASALAFTPTDSIAGCTDYEIILICDEEGSDDLADSLLAAAGIVLVVLGVLSYIGYKRDKNPDKNKDSSSVDYYVGASYATLNFSSESSDPVIMGDASLDGLMLRLGAQWNKNFSGEIRIGPFNEAITDVTIENDHGGRVLSDLTLADISGIYLRLGAESGKSYPYLIAGSSSIQLDDESGYVYQEGSDFSYGVGVDINFTGAWSGNIEYMNYYDDKDIELSGFTFGITKRF